MVSPMQSVLATSLSNVLLLVGGLLMVFVTSWKLSILAITSIFPIIQITRIYARYSRKLNKQCWAALAESSNLATQAITNIRTVRAFGTEDYEDGLYREATAEALDKSILDAKASSLSYTLTSYLDLGTTVLLLWYGGLVVMRDEQNDGDHLTVGKLITFQLYWNMMNNAYNNLNSLINQFTKAAAAAQKVMMLSDTLPDLVTKRTANTEDSVDLKGEIDVQGLAFHYQMRPEHQVLHDVNLHIPPATTCAFVGRSGGGKSTLIHLLLRFYDAKEGCIRYDGVGIDEWDLTVLRRQMSLVMQDTQLFATSIIENITYGMKPNEYSREEVIKAAKAANGQRCEHNRRIGRFCHRRVKLTDAYAS
jgi:ABC-type multidrug transport system fused ATPase/permease subunit